MTYASLLVAVEDGPESDSRLELACDLSIAFDSHLIGLSIGSLAPPLYDPLAGGAMVGELLTLYRDMAEADVERARSRFHEIVKARGVEAGWKGEIGYPAEVCARAAGAADLVLVGGRNPRAPYHAPDVADVLMRAGRPVLMVPPVRLRNPVGEPALVAWKDCREARLALAAALPLLQRAAGVSVCAFGPADAKEEVGPELAEVVRYLALHGISAEAAFSATDGSSVGSHILGEADARRAGLIVAGGYGHARLQEWALGGVTRELLADSPVCVCLSH